MTTNIEEEKQRLSQAGFLSWLTKETRPTDMLTVYLNDVTKKHNRGIFCALIPNEGIKRSLDKASWDLHEGDGLPGAVVSNNGAEESVEYLRFGETSKIEPLIILRDFHGMREAYIEISEEFRLFHRLYYDQKQNRYLKIEDSGNEFTVAIVEPNRIQIRLQEIKQFLAIKEMHLAVMFDCVEHSMAKLSKLELEETPVHQRENMLVYSFNYGDMKGMSDTNAFSRLMGKFFIEPFPKEKSGFWGFAPDKQKRYADFIIGIDDSGDEIINTADDTQLANYFGANPGSPHYLTPVHFKKEVLDKYYHQPSKYSVEDGYLRCGTLWGLQMDNHQRDQVVAWLGDLGSHLPYEEQLHWKSCNIAPTGNISETFHGRQIKAEFANTDQPEHLFKSKYDSLRRECEAKHGWTILLPLAPEDMHFFVSLRIPANDEQKDFDDLILALTKLLIDSLNEDALKKLSPDIEKNNITGSISRLEKVLEEKNIPEYQKHTAFLRKLQGLRSTGTAHRKGGKYQKAIKEFNLEERSLRDAFQDILNYGNAFLEFLEGLIQKNIFK